MELPSQRERAAWAEALYRTYGTDVFRLCLSILKDTAAAEDAAQETFYKAYRHGAPGDPAVEKAWLFRIAHNTACDMLRKSRWETTETTPLAPAEPPDSRLEFLERIAPLRRKDQQIVALRIIAGLTAKEIAPILHMTPAAVQKRYERALAALRQAQKEEL